jgi:hypothetical protein
VTFYISDNDALTTEPAPPTQGHVFQHLCQQEYIAELASLGKGAGVAQFIVVFCFGVATLSWHGIASSPGCVGDGNLKPAAMALLFMSLIMQQLLFSALIMLS